MLDILLLILVFIIGFALIVLGGNMIVTFCKQVSKMFGINEFLVGATLISLGTTLPETILTILGITQGLQEVVIGGIFGSVLVNNCLILGASLLTVNLLRINRDTKDKFLYVMLLTLFVSILVLTKLLNVFTAILLIVLFLVYFISSYLNVKQSLENRDKIIIEKNTSTFNFKARQILKFIVGFVLLFAGAQLSINASETLIELINIKSSLIGVIILALGTSLPEIITSFISIRKKSINMAIGNIVGANIINLTLNLGLAGILNGAKSLLFNSRISVLVLITLILSSLILALPILIGKRTYKWQGTILTSLYAITCIIIILL